MKIQTHCTHCQKEYTLDFQLIGRKAKCRECWQQFIIKEEIDAPQDIQTK